MRKIWVLLLILLLAVAVWDFMACVRLVRAGTARQAIGTRAGRNQGARQGKLRDAPELRYRPGRARWLRGHGRTRRAGLDGDGRERRQGSRPRQGRRERRVGHRSRQAARQGRALARVAAPNRRMASAPCFRSSASRFRSPTPNRPAAGRTDRGRQVYARPAGAAAAEPPANTAVCHRRKSQI